jgi:hypothetical protein
MARGFLAISISQENKKKIEEYLKSRYPEFPPPISTFVAKVVFDYIEKDEMMRQYGPYLSYAGNNENTIFIKDEKNGRVAPVRVVIKGNGQYDLLCELDERDDCMHVGFVFALPEFYKILKEKGVKPRALK